MHLNGMDLQYSPSNNSLKRKFNIPYNLAITDNLMNEQNTIDHSTNSAQPHQQVDWSCFGKAKL